MTGRKITGMRLLLRQRPGTSHSMPAVQSQWIYHPGALPGVKDTMQVPLAFFRKTFQLPGKIIAAKLQLLGDTWSKIFVNGTFVGEVYARRSLSLTVEKERAKIFDIMPYLTDTVNCIAVSARNFLENGSGGANVYCEIKTSDDSVHIVETDSTWKTSDTEITGWETPGFDDSQWKQAAVFSYPTPIVKPNLATGRTSFYER